MNTRLQVEHPVTEMVTGFDLVKLQIIAAQGEAFNFSQEDIKQAGHAFECRVYAEDPDNNFLPTNGRIIKIGKSDYARLDCGFIDGNNISTNYDPMLAKVITFSHDRQSASDKMVKALNDITFSGVKTNRDYMKRVLLNESFIKGEYHTHFLAQNKEKLAPKDLSDYENAKVISNLLMNKEHTNNSWNNLSNFRNV
jgi:3-methylcrotonyl-CoA carboxylase alpha subunit